jgi:xanthine dehydrogenase YagR molybdenum-binding subunit
MNPIMATPSSSLSSPRPTASAAHPGAIGQPLDRVDGRLKVTGRAPYAFEERSPQGRAAYGFLVEATVAKGRLTALDTVEAEQAPGVLLVLTHRNVPAQAPKKPKESAPQLQGEAIAHHGQPIALVVAESFEAARAAAGLVRASYASEVGHFELDAAAMDAAVKPEPMMQPPDSALGDFDQAFADAAVRIDARYTTPHQVHMQMEPHATLAWWEGDALTVHTSNQMLNVAQKVLAGTLQVPKEKVRVLSRYVGGGFGAKLEVLADAVLAALAARELQRPVKVALTRQQIFHVGSHRSPTVQRVRLGADRDGRLHAIAHEVWSGNTPGESFYEMAADQTRSLYAGAHRRTSHRLAALDLPVAASMRAPGEAVGMLALEVAMDELAEVVGLDPLELRLRNEPADDPESHRPYSTRKLTECLREGAERFGWSKRPTQPGQWRDGPWLVGYGLASAIRGNLLQPSKASVHLGADGRLVVRTAMTDIGTGSYTVLTQIAAETLGLDPALVRVDLGDTDFPEAAGSGGSWGAASAGSSVLRACEALRIRLAERAGVAPEAASFVDGCLVAGGKSQRLATLAGEGGLSAEGAIEPGDEQKRYAHFGHGAHFAEVGVDVATGEVRVRRMLGVFAAGRILNPKTARSQALGGMVFGIGAALTEEALVDATHGFYANHDMAEYHVPVHADVPAIEAIYLDEPGDKANPLHIKGVGELGISGAGAAIANAIYNACGARLRDYPFTLDKVLAARPDVM